MIIGLCRVYVKLDVDVSKVLTSFQFMNREVLLFQASVYSRV